MLSRLSLATRNKILTLGLVGILACMVGLVYVSPTLYNLFCQVTGFGGTTQVSKAAPGLSNPEVEFLIRFDANTSPSLPWEFYPKQKTMRIRAGEPMLAYYIAKNLSDQPIKGSALYNVVPNKVGYYFNKIECFCFTEQELRPGEQVEMPIQFYIDPEMLNDLDTKEVRTITLSYSFGLYKE